MKSLVSAVTLLCLAACSPGDAGPPRGPAATPPDASADEEVATGTAPASGTVQVNGIPFAWRAEGSGPVCMVVGDALTVAQAMPASLKSRFRWVFLESRVSTPEARVGDVSGVTMDTLLADIEGARAALELGDVCVLGHSISGLIALEYARAYPEHATRVIMHGTPPHYNPAFGRAVQADWEARGSAERKAVLAANVAAFPDDSLDLLDPSERMKRAYVRNAPRYFYDPTFDPSPLLDGVYWNVPAWDHLFGEIFPPYDLADGPPIEVPVFLAIGRHDYVVPFTEWDAHRSKIPDLTLRVFDESGHYPMLEEPERFEEALMGWVGEG